MLYFISSAIGLKIGISADPVSRRKTINTSSPHPCKLVLALAVPNEAAAERALHESLNKYRLNGEWFSVSVAKALQTLLDLNIISEPHPKLELEYFPDMDPDFPRWFMRVHDVDQVYEETMDEAWREEGREFLQYREQGLNLEDMIRMGRAKRPDVSSQFALIREQLRQHSLHQE